MADLLGWDADFYNSLSDDTINVSLSQKEIYILGNLLPMVSWANRWSGDISGLDLDAIRGEMEFTILDEVTGGTMSCEDIADCIDTDETVEAAIINQLSANNYTQNIQNTDATTLQPLPAAKLAESLIPADFDCSSPERNMSIARALVREIDESVMDLFEIIELITNPVELGAIMTDSIPVVSVGGDAAEVGNWLQENIQEHYQAAYIQSVEDEISCAIFCFLQTSCDISLDDIISIYEGLDAPTPPSDLNDIQAVIEWILALSLALSTLGVVAVFHLIALYLMRFGGKVSTILGFNSIKTAIASASSNLDFSFVDLCDDCPITETPQTYFMLYQDFRNGLGNWVINQGIKTANGIETLTYSSQARASVQINDLGNEYQFIAAGQRSQRRGSNGNGSDDLARCYAYTNINLGGTFAGVLSLSSITCNTNDCDHQNVLVTPTSPCESLWTQVAVQGVSAVPTNFGRLTEVIYYGLCNGTSKPANSVYVASIPAVGSLFPA